ncbi:hypothetical protein CONLIGDRAFT_7490 [Coniochaeta ligniaria NRRL 30616]|uniref:Uncharacterized protein n=1 Tax=Coniochaeta ligniaria NRRL 30616 TaxID=1408157 RepID=A0A1J7K2V8_9PEZI|nr:hypothetical protein CONLIGDRAFT_7490 [Coniochaeta ligniaria NRRL 30616]
MNIRRPCFTGWYAARQPRRTWKCSFCSLAPLRRSCMAGLCSLRIALLEGVHCDENFSMHRVMASSVNCCPFCVTASR